MRSQWFSIWVCGLVGGLWADVAVAGDDAEQRKARRGSVELRFAALLVLPPASDVGIVPMVTNFPSPVFGYFLSEKLRIAVGFDWLHGVYDDERHYVSLGMRPSLQYHVKIGKISSVYPFVGTGVHLDSEHNHLDGLENTEVFWVPQLHGGLGAQVFSGPVMVGAELRGIGFYRIGNTERSPLVAGLQLDIYGGLRF